MIIAPLTAAIFSFSVLSATSLQASALNDSSECNKAFPSMDSEFYPPFSSEPQEYYANNDEYPFLSMNPYPTSHDDDSFDLWGELTKHTGFLPDIGENYDLMPESAAEHYTNSAYPDSQQHTLPLYSLHEISPSPEVMNLPSSHNHYSYPEDIEATYHSNFDLSPRPNPVPYHPVIYSPTINPSYEVKTEPVNFQSAYYPTPVVNEQIVTPKSKLESHLEDALLNRAKMNVEVITPEKRYHQLAESFPYDLTTDQVQGISTIETELASGRPMNHMVVGDVGFGKTELALRAACLVSLKGKQVVVVAPRKTLANQHYTDFSKRLSPLGIDVIKYSQSKAKEQRKRDNLIKDGKAQVIVGTSALFNATEKFKDLGLIIIDEEQLFGVKQKETLKAHFKDAHVLWMSATPIPRTFNLIQKGLMSLSELKTPPVGRVNTQTFNVGSSDDELKKMAQKEFDREGQIYYVTHNISPNLDTAYTRWTSLFPEKKISKLHGDMKDDQKQEIMENFRMGNIDVLVCTKIVSVGLNVPKANSIFIEDPSKFGTSELVQLRGRVGRSTTQAYAYIINENEPSIKVQKFIETASIGGGVELAKHDAEERGFGEILGEKQNDRTRNRPSKIPNPKRQKMADYFKDTL